MCVAVAIVAGIAAGGSITAAKMQSGAAKNAAKTQSDAGDKALAFQKEQYAQSRADFDPYRQGGVSALQRLGTQATAAPPSFRPGPPPQLGMPQGPASASPMPPPMMPQAGQTPPSQPGGALWTVKGPDGSTQQLPPEIAQKFIARGASRIA